MADKKISQLPAGTTPLDGTELVPIVQEGATVHVPTESLRGLQGETGPQGPQGVQGIQGPAGTTSWTGITDKPTTVSGFGIADAATDEELTTGLAGKVDKVAGKGLSTEDYTSAEKTKLAGVAEGAQVNTVASVAGKTGAVTLVKGDIGLGSVDNTADVDKPVSTAQAAAIAGKEPTITAGTAAQYWRGDKSWRDFFTDVRVATLTGLSTATNAAVAAADTVLVALGKLQAQINNAMLLTGNQTVAGNKSFTGSVLITGSGAIGYGVGAGGTVSQATDKSTSVSLNKLSGTITMNAAALAPGASVWFTQTNSLATAVDSVVANATNEAVVNPASYDIDALVGDGVILYAVRNRTGGALAEAVRVNFTVHKGARA